jgi:hypothetical protein
MNKVAEIFALKLLGLDLHWNIAHYVSESVLSVVRNLILKV